MGSKKQAMIKTSKVMLDKLEEMIPMWLHPLKETT